MVEGTIRLQGTVIGLLMVGLSWMKVFFTDDRTLRRVEVLSPWIDRRSHCCSKCGSILMKGIGHGNFRDGETLGYDDANEDISCLECGEVIPAGRSECGNCGWTFKK